MKTEVLQLISIYRPTDAFHKWPAASYAQEADTAIEDLAGRGCMAAVDAQTGPGVRSSLLLCRPSEPFCIWRAAILSAEAAAAIQQLSTHCRHPSTTTVSALSARCLPTVRWVPACRSACVAIAFASDHHDHSFKPLQGHSGADPM